MDGPKALSAEQAALADESAGAEKYADPHAEAAAEGHRDFAAGRVISHEKMTAWLKSWGSENELSPPELDNPELDVSE